jgi:hypothetical protein
MWPVASADVVWPTDIQSHAGGASPRRPSSPGTAGCRSGDRDRPHVRCDDDEHRALRPAWICAVDRGPWPCSPARRALAEAFLIESPLPRSSGPGWRRRRFIAIAELPPRMMPCPSARRPKNSGDLIHFCLKSVCRGVSQPARRVSSGPLGVPHFEIDLNTGGSDTSPQDPRCFSHR